MGCGPELKRRRVPQPVRIASERIPAGAVICFLSGCGLRKIDDGNHRVNRSKKDFSPLESGPQNSNGKLCRGLIDPSLRREVHFAQGVLALMYQRI